MQEEIATPNSPDRPTTRPSRRNLLAGLLANLADPPLSERRFWQVQLMVVAVLLTRLGVDLARDHGVITTPGFVWNALLLVPVVYGGTVFGLVGSLGAALTGIVVLLPEELVTHHGNTSLWGAWSILVTLLVVAVLIGYRFEVERREREQLLAVERARAVADTRVDMVEAASSEDLATSERRFRLAFENNTAGMAIAQLDGRLVDVNRSYCEMLGYTPAELLGRNLMEVTHPEDRLLTSEMNRRLTSGAVDQARYVKRYIHKDGQVLYAEVSTGFIANGGAAPVSLVASVKDVTEERALLDQLTHQALHDPLTGLPNRALFEDRIAQVRQRLTRHGGRNAVFLLDLDDFNAVNDTLGHHVGDELLIELTHRLEQATRSSDTLCRFSGDEFIYLAEGLESDAEEVADRLLGTFTEPFVVGGTSLEQRASIGVVLYDASTTDDGGLLRDADTALSEAKRQGKGRYVVFAPEMHTQASHRFELIHELRQALPSGELAMAYQPLVDLVTEEVVGFEALMRWQHPTRGPVPPDEFIPLAEQSDLIIELGAFALNEATTAAASWRPAAPTKRMPYVAINFSARQFHDPGLLSKIDAALASSGLSPSRLVLEITESVALADVETTTRVIEHVGELGAGIALDDFGTGYSSLSYLARLRPRIIKIDRSFVSPPHESLYDSTLLEAIVSLGHKLDLTVLAEGIETTGQLAHLRELGCELGQGYLFSRAVSAEQAARIVVSGRAAPPAQR